MWLCFFIEHENTFCHFPQISAGASFLLQSVKFRSIKAALVKISTLNHNSFFPEFSCGVMYVFRIARCASVQRILWISAAVHPDSLNAWNSSLWQQILYHQFFSFFVGQTVHLSVHENDFFTESASRLCFVFLTYGSMAKITLRIRALPTDVVLARSWRSLSTRTTASESFPFRIIFHSLRVCSFEAREDSCIAFQRLFSSRRELQAFPLEHCPFAFHWKHSPCFQSTLTSFPLHRDFADTPVSYLSFLASKFRALIF